ncbi:hypothetical protein E0L35_07505 [Halomonas sp. ATBC28]|uniref:Uncharacterized protein n=1 Tax=Vreelandella titanicae TaxID=664683 RepID=A0AAP9SZ13_9GAMM|nr:MULTISPECIES: hypothetical protein [Halomonas]QKS22488.1 hypothetical protein FX987_00230 [Halomonas titanicae]TMU25716.1 hypothetical protein E0L35_07505 [Halomonas sp. ATBC28]CDG51901.1 conserved exported hypothetical protein [Halomonas sp. A3H3]SDI04430.1 hypothetical protein SAMN04487867_101222 [Halomonas titanicae]|tara:strand:+ start:2653 stop:3249 length:597 start_codon:yes stop_codon:yes gene_type:complete
MRNVLSSVGVLMISAALLAGCGGTDEPSESASTVEQTSVPEPTVAEIEVVEAEEVAPLVVEMSAHVSLRSDRRLMVEGESNLPDETLVQIIVEREISSVRWRERTRIEDGVFAAGPFGPGSGLPDGGYIVRVEVSEGSVQPEAVQARIGHEGQHLAGELVSQSRHGLGQVATYSRRFLVGSEPRQTRDQVEVLESPGR